jgi:hypothetical protein
MAATDHPRSNFRYSLRNVLFALLFVGIVIAPFYQTRLVGRLAQNTIHWQRPPLGPGDIYSPWFGVCAAIHGANPYSLPVTQQIQIAVYGQVLSPASTLDPMAFVYPAHLVFLLGPFAWLPWRGALLCFTLLSTPLLVATSWAWVRLCIPSVNRMELFLILVLSMSSWPAVSASQGRQPTLLILALTAFAALLFRNGFDTVPAILLAFSTVKPNLVALLLAWLLIVAAAQRRFRFLAVFSTTLALLLAGSLILVPGWMPRWISAVTAYSHQSGKAPLFIHLLGFRFGLLVLACVAVALLIRLVQVGVSWSGSLQFSGSVAILLAATSCLIPANPWMIYNNLLLIPAVLLLYHWRVASGIAALLRGLALITVIASFASVLLCVACSWIFGYLPALAVLPNFVSFVLPVVVVPAILCCNWTRIEGASAVAKAKSSHHAGTDSHQLAFNILLPLRKRA